MNSALLAAIPEDMVGTSSKTPKTMNPIADPSFVSCSSESYGFSSDNDYQNDRSRMKKKRSICQAMTASLKIAKSGDTSCSEDESSFSSATTPRSFRRRTLRPRPTKPEPRVASPAAELPPHRDCYSPAPPSSESDEDSEQQEIFRDRDNAEERCDMEGEMVSVEQTVLANVLSKVSEVSFLIGPTSSSGSLSHGHRSRSPIRSPGYTNRKRRRRGSSSSSSSNDCVKKRLKDNLASSNSPSGRPLAAPIQRERMQYSLHRYQVHKRVGDHNAIVLSEDVAPLDITDPLLPYRSSLIL